MLKELKLLLGIGAEEKDLDETLNWIQDSSRMRLRNQCVPY